MIGHGMAGQPLGETLGRFLACDVAHRKGMIPNDRIAHQADVGLAAPAC